MTYIDVETGEYPLFIGDLMIKTSLPEDEALKVIRYKPVLDTPLPSCEKTQRIIELPPTEENGVWRKNFIVREETQEERDARIQSEDEMAISNRSTQDLTAAGSQPDVIG